MNRESIYFSHDADAMNDPKCILLIDQLGMEGYGIFWGLIEMLRVQPEYSLPIELIPAIASRFKTSEPKVKSVIGGYGLFVIEQDKIFFSKSLRDRMCLMEYKREIKRKGGIRSAESRKMKALTCSLSVENEHNFNTTDLCSNTTSTQLTCVQTQVNKRKEKKLNEIITPPYIPPRGTNAINMAEEEGEEGGFLNYDDITPPADGIERNFEALKRRMLKLKVPLTDFKAICRLSNYGMIGDSVWSVLMFVENANASNTGKIKLPGRYIIKILKGD